MDYTGKWKLHSVMTYDDDNMPIYLSPEEYLASPMPYIDENGFFNFMNYRFAKED